MGLRGLVMMEIMIGIGIWIWIDWMNGRRENDLGLGLGGDFS